MVNIQEIQDQELSAWIKDHYEKGGALRISVYNISVNYLGELPDEYLAHLVTARHALEKQNYESNLHVNKLAAKGQRHTFQIFHTDSEKLDSSGEKLELAHFLGPHFDLEKNKPIVIGQLSNETLNSYFYYDQVESPANKIDINKLDQKYRQLYPSNKGWFIHSLIDPPHNMRLGKDIRKRGEYVLRFLDYFFSDLNQITVYSWSTDCSPVFDAGKEWWGSYFWTIYNPVKQWYVGIVASETD